VVFCHDASSEDSHVSIQRMEILTGVGRRRRYRRAMKEQIVSESLAGESTVTEVARRHDVDRSLVYRWRRELGVVGRGEATDVFLPVEVKEEARAHAQRMPATAGSRSDLIEIGLGGGCCVRVGAGFDADALCRVLGVLERRAVGTSTEREPGPVRRGLKGEGG
jgi:transposase